MDIMLGMGVIKANIKSGLKTLDKFVDKDPNFASNVALGIETSGDLVHFFDKYSSSFSKIVIWTEQLDRKILDELPDQLPRPFYHGFSYGGFLNKMLILARTLKCSFFVRLDPGILPPDGDSLWSTISTNIELLSNDECDVLSGQYADRLAFRDTAYLLKSKKSKCLEFVSRETGVKIKNQITGGALFMSPVPGMPAIPFEAFEAAQGKKAPTLSWATDDGIFDRLPYVRSKVVHSLKVPRHEPFGKPKPPSEYFRGISGMVLLNGLMNGDGTDTIDAFINELNKFLDPGARENRDEQGRSLLPLLPNDVAPAPFRKSIKDGFEEYGELQSQWETVVEAVVERVRGSDLLVRIKH